jgi:hypothetical protein
MSFAVIVADKPAILDTDPANGLAFFHGLLVGLPLAGSMWMLIYCLVRAVL